MFTFSIEQIHELSKLGEKVTTGGRCVKKTSMQVTMRMKSNSILNFTNSSICPQETPKTVDELLDSFNDTRV